MHTLNLTAMFIDGEDGQRLAEVNGLPRLGALLSSAQLRQLARQMRKERDAALARVAELERGKVYVEARQCDECQHGGINDSATGVAACHECDWTGPEPEEDRCPGCQRENCMAAACPQCGGRYVLVASEEIAAPVAQAQQLNDLDKQCRDDVARALGLRPNQERGFAWSYLLASIKSCVKASGDSAQAQHSVPAYVSYTTQPAESLAGIALRQLKDESRWVEIRDINAHAFPDMRSHSYYPAGTVIKLPAAAPSEKRSCEHAGCCNTAHPGTSLCIAHHSKKAQERLLAAAPGKEVGHE